MANYGYLALPRPLQAHDFLPILIAAVDRALGAKWDVRLAPYDYDGVTWEVVLPDTAVHDDVEAMNRWQAVGEDLGFMVALDLEHQQLAFRHGGMHPFVRWAQGCLEEELADHFGVGILYDATDETVPPRTKRYRKGSFKNYIGAGFNQPLNAEDEAYLKTKYGWAVPEGWWDGMPKRT